MKKDNNTENKNYINSNRRKLLSLAGAAGIAALFSPLISKATPTTIIEAGSNIDTASYIIFKDGNTIYAKNGTTGKIEFSGSDISAILTSINGVIIGGETIIIREGTYTPSTHVKFTKSIKLYADGDVIFNWNKMGEELFTFKGTYSGQFNISSDIVVGTNTISVTSVGTAAPGDLIILKDSVPWNPIDYPLITKGELHEISSISGTIITITDSVIHPYTVANSGYIVLLKPITVIVDNITIIGGGSTLDYRGINLEVTKNSIIRNCNIQKNGLREIIVVNSYNTIIENNVIGNNVYAGFGYGISVGNASAYTTISKNYLYNGRHCIALGGGSGNAGGVPRDTTIIANTIADGNGSGGSTTHHAIDSHGCAESFYIYNNVIYSPIDDYAIRSGAKITKIICNTIIGGLGISERETSKSGIPYPGYILEINGNTLKNATRLYSGIIDKLIIDNNNITSISNNYIVESGANYTKFSNNTVIGGNGINTRGYNLTPGYIFDIVDNMFIDSYSIFYGNNLGNIYELNIKNNIIKGNITGAMARFWYANTFNITGNQCDFDATAIGGFGIIAQNSGKGIISHNIIQNAYHNCIKLISINNTIISNNTILEWERRLYSDYGVILIDSSYNTVSNNTLIRTIDNSHTLGIGETGTSDYNRIFDNDLYQVGDATRIPYRIVLAGANTKIWKNAGYITENNILSGAFAIDSAGIKTVTIAHGLAITPAVQDCYLTVVQNTAVDDWSYNMIKVTATNATNVTAKINVSSASATGGTTAKLGLKAGSA